MDHDCELNIRVDELAKFVDPLMFCFFSVSQTLRPCSF